MATDGPDPAPCDRDVFENGVAVFMTNSIPSNAMEGWVRLVALRSKQRVDWSFIGGRAVVRAIGDIPKVVESIKALLPEHDQLYRNAVAQYGSDGSNPPRYFFDVSRRTARKKAGRR